MLFKLDADRAGQFQFPKIFRRKRMLERIRQQQSSE
jgi:hypothetical protein